MRQAFTLWPLDKQSAEQQISEDGTPVWALTDENAPLPGYRPWHILVGASVLVSLIFVAAALPRSLESMTAGALAAMLVLLYGVLHYRAISRLRTKLSSADRWNETLFERNGIALWREDWTAARDAVLAALESGERDMQAYFAARPNELRELRKKVIIKDANEIAVRQSGVATKAELIGPLDRILPDDDNTFVQWLVALARGDTLYRSEARLHLADGVIKDTLFYATLPRDMRGFEDILVSDLDITAYKAAQSRVAQGEVEIARAARIATMGALTASIAHEVNSPLAAIVTSSEAALLWLRRENPDIQEAVTAMLTVNQQAIRAQSVVDRARAYVNHTPIAMTPQSIGALVCEAIQLVQRDLLSLRTAIHMDVPDQLPHVLADAVNIQQILVNLILNAAQAMEGKDALKEISISADVDKRMMIVSVCDSGPGIDPQLLQSIFDPFFTTKAQGMGMGLAICKTCIAAHGGELWVSNRPGQGAAFHFSLPLAQAE